MLGSAMLSVETRVMIVISGCAVHAMFAPISIPANGVHAPVPMLRYRELRDRPHSDLVHDDVLSLDHRSRSWRCG